MKRETLRHPKVFDLMARLGIGRPASLGVLTLLWDFVGEQSPEGNVGKFSNGAIATACDWQDDPDTLIQALIDSGFLTQSVEHRLIVNDWPEHCENWVRKKLSRAKKEFCEDYNRTGDSVHRKYDDPAARHRPDTGAPPESLSKPIQTNPNQGNPTGSLAVSCDSAGTTTESSDEFSEYTFATQGKSSSWTLPAAKLAAYIESYPGLDVPLELRKARMWCEDAARKKTPGGMTRFLTRWLNRAADSTSTVARGSPAKSATPSVPTPEERERINQQAARALGTQKR